jgi:hypothetical protein
MQATLSEPLGILRAIHPDLNSFVLKIDLDELTIIYHPENFKLICVFNNPEFDGWHKIIDFCFEISDNISLLNLSLSICFFDKKNTIKTADMHFERIPYKLYRIRAN